MDLAKQIQIYGDSIMKGVQLDTASERYYLPKENNFTVFQEEYPLDIHNNSKFGCTIEKGCQQLQKALDKDLACDMVLLEYGGNDCDYDWAKVAENPEKEHLPHTDIHTFEKVYRKMLSMLKEHGLTPIMMSLPPVDGEKYLNWICHNGLNRENILKFLGDVQMIYRFQELYSNAAVKIARETNTLLIDVRSVFLDKRNFKDLICEDGIHPNEEGHKLMKRVFEEFTKNYLSGATTALV